MQIHFKQLIKKIKTSLRFLLTVYTTQTGPKSNIFAILNFMKFWLESGQLLHYFSKHNSFFAGLVKKKFGCALVYAMQLDKFHEPNYQNSLWVDVILNWRLILTLYLKPTTRPSKRFEFFQFLLRNCQHRYKTKFTENSLCNQILFQFDRTRNQKKL